MAITNFGVMMTPALVVDGTVKIQGKVPSVDELKKLLAVEVYWQAGLMPCAANAG